jgi:hypothetical protein
LVTVNWPPDHHFLNGNSDGTEPFGCRRFREGSPQRLWRAAGKLDHDLKVEYKGEQHAVLDWIQLLQPRDSNLMTMPRKDRLVTLVFGGFLLGIALLIVLSPDEAMRVRAGLAALALGALGLDAVVRALRSTRSILSRIGPAVGRAGCDDVAHRIACQYPDATQGRFAFCRGGVRRLRMRRLPCWSNAGDASRI